jgi:hypothetical protein
MTARVWLLVTGLVGACSPTYTVLRSNHYRVTLPEGWIVEAAGSSEEDPAVLRVPPAPSAKGDGRLELRIYGWLTPPSAPDALDEVMGRLAGSEQESMRAAGGAAVEQCRDIRRSFVVFGEPQRGARLRAKTGHHVVFTAGRSAGSTIAIVGFVPDREPFCDNVAAMESAITDVAGRFAAVELSGIPVPPVVAPIPIEKLR